MKKIYILLIFIGVLFIFTKFSNTQSITESIEVHHESLNIDNYVYINIPNELSPALKQIEKMKFKSDLNTAFIYQGFYPLKMGQKNNFEIELNFLSSLKYFDKENIDDIYILIDFETLNTSDGFFNSDNSNISIYDNNILKVQLIDNLIDNIIFDIWWSDVNNPDVLFNDSGFIRYKGMKLYVDYIKPIKIKG